MQIGSMLILVYSSPSLRFKKGLRFLYFCPILQIKLNYFKSLYRENLLTEEILKIIVENRLSVNNFCFINHHPRF